MNRKSLLIAMGIVLGCASVPLTASADTYREVRSADGYYDRDRDYYRHEGRRGLSDNAIENRVERALRRELGADANDIYVRVEDRDVYLSGRVDRPGERWRARRVADNVYGVRSVYADRLVVRRY